jgi:thymidylate kinase
MKTLIFEGIATSGKSTITSQLVDALQDEIHIELATEEQTHEPIMAQRSELNTQFFEKLINDLALKNPDLLIFDRLYITQAYRANSGLAAYSAIEDLLLTYSPHTIILKVGEEAIAQRIKTASEHREKEWLEYLKTKGSNFDEIAGDYINQQRGLLQLAAQSKLPYTVFDTTSHDYRTITDKILKIIQYLHPS